MPRTPGKRPPTNQGLNYGIETLSGALKFPNNNPQKYDFVTFRGKTGRQVREIHKNKINFIDINSKIINLNPMSVVVRLAKDYDLRLSESDQDNNLKLRQFYDMCYNKKLKEIQEKDTRNDVVKFFDNIGKIFTKVDPAKEFSDKANIAAIKFINTTFAQYAFDGKKGKRDQRSKIIGDSIEDMYEHGRLSTKPWEGCEESSSTP